MPRFVQPLSRFSLHSEAEKVRFLPFARSAPYSTVPYRLHRLVVLWFVIALQALTPFVHAHSGVAQANHAGFLHVHQNVHGDATAHALEPGEKDAAVGVAQGLPAQHAGLAVANATAPFTTTSIPSPTAMASRPGAGWPVSAPLHLAPPDHTRPLALAPPFC